MVEVQCEHGELFFVCISFCNKHSKQRKGSLHLRCKYSLLDVNVYVLATTLIQAQRTEVFDFLNELDAGHECLQRSLRSDRGQLYQ